MRYNAICPFGRLASVTSSAWRGDPLTLVLAEIADRTGCRLLPPAGPATVPAGLTIPDEVRRLHERCGGLILFEGAPFAWRISGPRELVAASPRLLTPELADEIAADDPTELTNGCYVIADGGTGGATEPHMVIDLQPDRAGRCYAVGWDTYGLVGEMPIVAHGIVELLHRMLAAEGMEATLSGPNDVDAYGQV